MEHLIKYVNNFKDMRVLVVGDVILDRYVDGEVKRINPEAPVPILDACEQVEMTGGAGNVAKNLAALGARASLIGVVGEDFLAGRVREAAEIENYQLRLVTDKDRPTTLKTRYTVEGQQLLRVDWEKNRDVMGRVEDKIVSELIAALPEVDGVIISDYDKGVVTEKVARVVLEMAKQQGVLVAVDAKPPRAKFFRGATFMSPNLKEAHEYLGIDPLSGDRKDPAELAEGVRAEYDTDVFVTIGSRGMFVCTEDGVRRLVKQRVRPEVVNVSGAGDTAVAVLALTKLAGASSEEAAGLANTACAVVVSKAGSVGVTIEELISMIKSL